MEHYSPLLVRHGGQAGQPHTANGNIDLFENTVAGLQSHLFPAPKETRRKGSEKLNYETLKNLLTQHH